MNNDPNLQACIDSLAQWAYTDSHIEVDKDALREKLLEDFKATGRFLTEKECEEFICGDDEGEVPYVLITSFPHTNEYLESYWA